jgi:hypothetical protein
LETFKFNTWIELAEAYRDLFFAKSTLFRFFNRYGKVLYAFLITITISSLEMLSDAIVCRVKWNNLNILYERDIMLGDN